MPKGPLRINRGEKISYCLEGQILGADSCFTVMAEKP
jgi:hypothetical protein